MTVLAALADLLGFEWRRWTCELIDRLRPGQGHRWLAYCDPPACSWCGSTRGALYRHGRWT